jgi:malate dehydrogenase (oxaloacetate-decarboxylating)(NADP+)
LPCRELPRGLELLQNPVLNKGTAFTEEERERLGLCGLLPPRVCSMEDQAQRVLENFRRKSTPLEQYIYLIGLQDRNQTLFYRVLADHLEEMMPVIYTPTVGLACQRYGHIYRRSRGLFLTGRDRGRVRQIPRDRGYRRGAHPGFGGSGGERHGHSGGEADALHGLCRD